MNAVRLPAWHLLLEPGAVGRPGTFILFSHEGGWRREP